MKHVIQLTAIVLIFVGESVVNAFQNLGFEEANLPAVEYGDFTPIPEALPGWRVFEASREITHVYHNNLRLGTAGASVLGPGWRNGVIEGQYHAVLQSQLHRTQGALDVSLVQSGIVPANANSLLLKISGVGFSIALDGIDLPLYQLETNPGFGLYGADISQFAGGTHLLRISSLTSPTILYNTVGLDSISFSPMVVPEPSVVVLFAIGCGAIYFTRQTARRVSE